MSNEKALQINSASEIALKDLADGLRKREAEIDSLVEGAAKTALKAIWLAFAQGDDLIAAKAVCGHGNFKKWVEDNFPKSYDLAWRYMKLGSVPKIERVQFLNDAKTINELYRRLGILPPEPEKEDGTARISIPPMVQRLNWICEHYQDALEGLENMQELERAELKTKLQPIVDIWEKL